MLRVLLIDDEPFYYKLIQKPLKKAGYDLAFARNGKEGLATIPIYKPDVIIMDVRLPDFTGYEIVERLRRDPNLGTIPVIFVSGQQDLNDKLKAFELGADDYLVKPFQPEELVARLKILARRGEAMKVVQQLETRYVETSIVVALHSLRGGVGCSGRRCPKAHDPVARQVGIGCPGDVVRTPSRTCRTGPPRLSANVPPKAEELRIRGACISRVTEIVEKLGAGRDPCGCQNAAEQDKPYAQGCD